MSQINVDTIATVAGVEHARLVQVQSTSKADVFTSTSTSLADITGFSQAITPTNSANKILVVASMVGANSSAGNWTAFTLIRGTTAIAIGTGGSSKNYSTLAFTNQTYEPDECTIVFLDSPSTASAVTYKVQMEVSAGTGKLNGRGDDGTVGTHSSITVMEIRT
jgi:hypothetical protein